MNKAIAGGKPILTIKGRSASLSVIGLRFIQSILDQAAYKNFLAKAHFSPVHAFASEA
jgi:hypothetical protein